MASDNQRLKDDNAQIKYKSANKEYTETRNMVIANQLISKGREFRKYSWFYISFVIIVCSIWFVDKTYTKLLNSYLSMVIPLVLVRFIDHKSINYCLKYTFLKRSRITINRDLQKQMIVNYELKHSKPILADYKIE